jgi:Flp pilus assembly protein TadD
VETRYHLGARLQRAGRLALAAREYDRVLQLDPTHARARLNRAYAELYADPMAAAVDFFTAGADTAAP